MAWRHARYSLFCPNNIILPKVGIGGSLQFLQGSPGTLFCSEGVPSIFYRGPRGPLFRRCIFCKHFGAGREEGCRVPTIFAQVQPRASEFPLLFIWVPLPGRVSKCIFCKHFAAGREEGCRVPPIFAGVHASRVMVPSTFNAGPQALACVIFCRRFAAGWEEGCKVPPIIAGVHASHVRVPFTFHMSPKALVCVQVHFLQAFRSWSGGRWRVPPIFAGVHALRVMVSSTFHTGQQALACPCEFFANISLLVGRKGVGRHRERERERETESVEELTKRTSQIINTETEKPERWICIERG